MPRLATNGYSSSPSVLIGQAASGMGGQFADACALRILGEMENGHAPRNASISNYILHVHCRVTKPLVDLFDYDACIYNFALYSAKRTGK